MVDLPTFSHSSNILYLVKTESENGILEVWIESILYPEITDTMVNHGNLLLTMKLLILNTGRITPTMFMVIIMV